MRTSTDARMDLPSVDNLANHTALHCHMLHYNCMQVVFHGIRTPGAVRHTHTVVVHRKDTLGIPIHTQSPAKVTRIRSLVPPVPVPAEYLSAGTPGNRGACPYWGIAGTGIGGSLAY